MAFDGHETGDGDLLEAVSDVSGTADIPWTGRGRRADLTKKLSASLIRPLAHPSNPSRDLDLFAQLSGDCGEGDRGRARDSESTRFHDTKM